MADETPTETTDPEPIPEPAPEVVPEAVPELIQPEVVLPLEPETPQIPVSEPIVSEPEQLPEAAAPAPVEQPPVQTSASVSVVAPVIHLARDLLVRARAVVQSSKQKKLDKILVLLDTKKNIGNDDVEKLLRVSDATATRYLSQLEKEGKVIQVGKTGKSVRYVRS